MFTSVTELDEGPVVGALIAMESNAANAGVTMQKALKMAREEVDSS